jgi:hypothetical protein
MARFNPVGWLRNQLLHTINRNRSCLAAHVLSAREPLVYSFMAGAGKTFRAGLLGFEREDRVR